MTTTHTINIPSLTQLPQAANQLIDMLGNNTIVALHGQMGAGKTTLTMTLLNALGVEQPSLAGSPSFALINEYRSDTTAELIYHFDLYRLNNLEEALEIGIEDYFDSGALCFIEWPDVVTDILPDDTIHCTITANPDQSRTLTIVTPD